MSSLTGLTQESTSISQSVLPTASQTASSASNDHSEFNNTLKVLSISFMACLFSIAIVACFCLCSQTPCYKQKVRLQHQDMHCSVIIAPEQCLGQEPTQSTGPGEQLELPVPAHRQPTLYRETDTVLPTQARITEATRASLSTISPLTSLPLPPSSDSRPLWDRSLDVILSGRRERQRQSRISEFFKSTNSTPYPARRAYSEVLSRRSSNITIRFASRDMGRQSVDSRIGIPQGREATLRRSSGQRSFLRRSAHRASFSAQSQSVHWWERVHDAGSTITLPTWALDSVQTAENRTTLSSGPIDPPQWWLDTNTTAVPAHFA